MTATSTERTCLLTAEDITALRTASSVTFHLAIGMSSGYFCGIRANIDTWVDQVIWTARQQRVFPETSTVKERHRVIPVGSNTAGGYRDNGGGFAAGTGSLCFEMIHSSQYSDTWQTIAGLLKPGDEIGLMWTADAGSSQVTRDAGVHVDSLQLVVQRPNNTRLVFLVRQSTSLDNTARMCRLVRQSGRTW